MRNIEEIIEELVKTAPNTIVTLFELDLTPVGVDQQFYFHAGTNELNQNITWQSQEYTAFPIEAKGFEITASGPIPTPSLTVANIGNTIGAIEQTYGPIIGAMVTRKRTFLKYLDAVNFSGGNANADPTVEFENDIYFINRKVSENRIFIEYELSSSWDVYGVKLPRRLVMQDTCPWVYRDSNCGYTGTTYFTVNDESTVNSNEDVCSKSLKGCELRFGASNILPFGGFPGAGVRRR